MTEKTTEKKVKKTDPAKTPKSSKGISQKAPFLAVIKTGGKQYLVEPGKTYELEKLEGEVGTQVVFDEVYLMIEGDRVDLGRPNLPLKIAGKIVDQFKGEKISVLKYKKRKRINKTYGHRQMITKVEITGINQ